MGEQKNCRRSLITCSHTTLLDAGNVVPTACSHTTLLDAGNVVPTACGKARNPEATDTKGHPLARIRASRRKPSRRRQQKILNLNF